MQKRAAFKIITYLILVTLLGCEKTAPDTQKNESKATQPIALKEDITDAAQFDQERIQFLWQAPQQEKRTIWSIKIDGTDLRQVLDEKELYATILPDVNTYYISAISRSPNNRYLALVINKEIIVHDLLTREYFIIGEALRFWAQLISWEDNAFNIYMPEFRGQSKNLYVDLNNLTITEKKEKSDTVYLKDGSTLSFHEFHMSKYREDKKLFRIDLTGYDKLNGLYLNNEQTHGLLRAKEKSFYFNIITGKMLSTFDKNSFVPWHINHANSQLVGTDKEHKQLIVYDVTTKITKNIFISGNRLSAISPLKASTYNQEKPSFLPKLSNLPKGYIYGDRKVDENYYFGAKVDGKAEGYGEMYQRYTHLWQYQEKSDVLIPLHYKGNWKADKFEGNGEVIYTNGSHYKGEFSSYLHHGQGRFTDKDGNGFDGSWYKGQKHGRGVCLTYRKPTPCEYYYDAIVTYEGELDDNGMRNGTGTFSWTNKYRKESIYKGNFKNDLFHGQGVLTENSYKNRVYKGQWQLGLRHGQGTQIGEGAHYEGQWKADKRHGKGTQTKGKAQYVGQWKADKRHGKGTQTDENTHYEGMWLNNFFSGHGVLTRNGNVYTGIFEAGQLYGQGTRKDKNGNSYNGEFKYSYFHGYGVLNYANGDQYNGQWISGMKSGKGKLTLVNSDFYDGDWINDKKHGEGVCYENSEEYPCQYFGGYKLNNIRDGYTKSQQSLSYNNSKGTFGDYIGELKNNVPHGQGSFFSKGNYTYIGQFEHGLFNGQGLLQEAYGFLTYEGMWLKNKPNGYGKNRVFEGHWKDGLAHGVGKLKINRQGFHAVTVEGNWQDGKISEGTIIYQDIDYIEDKAIYTNVCIYTGRFSINKKITYLENNVTFVQVAPQGECVRVEQVKKHNINALSKNHLQKDSK
ncbi:hypothetical protein I6F48_11030 [Pseudoalteromonas sp. SWYJ118]|uniref:hypothetical protein n=1 Tax=Pseudoalteromonas sp. SWYJ118 TaxID=2792062 RepID=UPI0018CD265A|nr:hypothetical protein [Pseudoalteromonas sp. SWYJ118]MBH0076095.1 hypothetical protein [Pseudoalteromonas sp. SWYJ118]